MIMLATAIALFSLTALLGMFLLIFILKGRETPKAIVFTHGPLALAGIVLLIIYVVKHSPGPLESLVLFAITALGGIVLVFKDLTGKKVPKWLAVVHGLLAVTGFVFLLMFAWMKA
jgi:hypothetical protein